MVLLAMMCCHEIFWDRDAGSSMLALAASVTIHKYTIANLVSLGVSCVFLLFSLLLNQF